MPYVRRVRACSLTGLAFCSMAATVAADPLPPVEELVGTWVATPVVNGQAGSFVLRLLPDSDGALLAELALPPIEAWRVPVGKVELLPGAIRIGSTRFVYDEENESLHGKLPEAIVPIHDVTVQLRRSLHPPQPGPPRSYGAAVDPAWTVATGGPIWSSPVASGGVLYIGSDDGKVYALGGIDGELRWAFETGGAVRSRPALHGDRVLVHSDDGELYCLTQASGARVWQTRIADGPARRSRPGEQGARYDHYAASATVANDLVYTATLAGDVVALDLRKGTIAWRYTTGDAIQGTPAVAAERVIAGSFDHEVYALDAGSGELLWQFDTGAPVVSSATIAGDLAIIGSRSYDLYGLDITSGEQRWRDYYWYSWIDSSATVAGGVAYIGSSDAGYVIAIAADTGRRLWVFDTAGSAWATPAVTADTVYAGSVGVTGYIVDHRPGFFAIDRDSGAARWSYLPERDESGAYSGFASSPAVDGEHVYVGGLDGSVYSFRR